VVERPTADPVAGFEDDDLAPGGDQLTCGGESGQAGTDDDGVDLDPVRHGSQVT
jgi:hypothetical protein